MCVCVYICTPHRLQLRLAQIFPCNPCPLQKAVKCHIKNPHWIDPFQGKPARDDMAGVRMVGAETAQQARTCITLLKDPSCTPHRLQLRLAQIFPCNPCPLQKAVKCHIKNPHWIDPFQGKPARDDMAGVRMVGAETAQQARTCITLLKDPSCTPHRLQLRLAQIFPCNPCPLQKAVKCHIKNPHWIDPFQGKPARDDISLLPRAPDWLTVL